MIKYPQTGMRQPQIAIGGGGGSHIRCAVLGNSKQSRIMFGEPALPQQTVETWENWTNWRLGSPFVFENLGLPGDTCQGMLGRASTIPGNTRVVILGDFVNDITGITKTAGSAAALSWANVRWSFIEALIQRLVNAGKTVIVPTSAPRGLTDAEANACSGSRAEGFDILNGYIKSRVPGMGGLVLDLDAVLTDPAQVASGYRFFRSAAWSADSSGDFVHLSNMAAFEAASAALPLMRSVAQRAVRDYSVYDGYLCQHASVNPYMSGTSGGVGGAGNVTLTGTIVSNWRVERANGDTTVALTGSQEPYTPSADMVGAWVEGAPATGNVWQRNVIAIPDSATAHVVRFFNGTALTVGKGQNFLNGGPTFGDEVFAEAEIEVVGTPVGLQAVWVEIDVGFSSGTSPADQSWAGASNLVARSGLVGFSPNPLQPLPSAFRVALRTPSLRVPENINATVNGTARVRIGAQFAASVANRAATIRFARPAWWRRQNVRMS